MWMLQTQLLILSCEGAPLLKALSCLACKYSCHLFDQYECMLQYNFDVIPTSQVKGVGSGSGLEE